MNRRQIHAERFRALHVPGTPLVLFNAWDPGSARAIAAAGADAVATGSWSVAAAHGFDDGEHMPLERVIDNLARIVRAVDLPVSVDLESGFGRTPEAVARTIEHAIAAGAVGCNLEDSEAGAEGVLRDAGDQAARLAAARAAANASGLGFYINARCDVYLQADASSQSAATLRRAALDRAALYAAAGADGLFLPGLVDAEAIGAIAAASPLPLNIMASSATPPTRVLAALGVARISHGPGPYRAAMQSLTAAARAAFGGAAAVAAI